MSLPGLPTVARILLVAHASRQRELSACLHVRDEDVAYTLRHASLDDVPLAVDAWDVIVVDGASFLDDGARLRLLRQLGRRPRRATILYVCSRLPLETELAYAGFWCDDLVYPGWAQPERIRRRVQVVALAPWRRAAAARRLAEQRGDRRLRALTVPSSEREEPVSGSLEPPLRGGVTRRDLERVFDAACRGGSEAAHCVRERLAGELERALEAVEAISAELHRLAVELPTHDGHATGRGGER
ncbi:MAG TPA: hypothetical protein RMH99_02710 [Sandaracinaceae bacterium LLY-WYZ-13_1]|nr:hypothetical protein [Sandaracinaceae bacterium LLY-WYZ-13_1]